MADQDQIQPKRNPLPGGMTRHRGMRIGLLGGSFNPAHSAHREISLAALKKLRLDFVWWLVSPGNPLKGDEDMAPLDQRLAGAKAIANHPKIRVSALERDLATRYTLDTITELQGRMPGAHLVWLMGADNMVQFPRWRGWQEIANLLPIAIFDRPGYSAPALSGEFARRFAAARVRESAIRGLAETEPPAWAFVSGPRQHQSATEIRRQQEKSL